MATYDDATMYQPSNEEPNQFGTNVPPVPPVPPVPYQSMPQEKSGNSAQTVALAGAAGVVLGAAAGGGVAYALTPDTTDDNPPATVEVDDSHVHITGEITCSDNLTFSQAFAQARAQLGAGGVFHWHGGVYGTYYANEWDAMSPQEQHDFTAQAMHQDVHTTIHHTAVVNNTVVVDTDAGMATGVNDGMSFSEAFAEARQELGPGGVFEWHGRLYNTYYANEWNNMPNAQRGGFQLADNGGGNAVNNQLVNNQGDFANNVTVRGGNVSVDNDDNDGNDSVAHNGGGGGNGGGNGGEDIGIDTTIDYEEPDHSFNDDDLHLTSNDMDDYNGMSDYMNNVYEA